ncbi:hypothetical protein, partial [Streptomyces sp. NPDC058964]|uniref:hypothetical protein n=1 Tax=Streptomyces sp. NPDC058964 TaxID=3346681 RepID=UPI0036998B0C
PPLAAFQAVAGIANTVRVAVPCACSRPSAAPVIRAAADAVVRPTCTARAAQRSVRVLEPGRTRAGEHRGSQARVR